VERVAGIEPASLAWKAKVLPLNYTRPVLHVHFIHFHVFKASMPVTMIVPFLSILALGLTCLTTRS
jgi:hypothetical protein